MFDRGARDPCVWPYRVRERYPTRHRQGLSHIERTAPYHSIRSPILPGTRQLLCEVIPDYSTITFSLRQLTKNDVKFQWEHKHEKAFQSPKDAITTAPVLAHYSLTAETKVIVDGSPWAIGAVLLQKQANDSYRQDRITHRRRAKVWAC